MKDLAIVNASDKRLNALIRKAVAESEGLFWFQWKRCRKQRSLSQNAWMWACIYPAIQRGMLNAWGEKLTVDEVHDYCKGEYLTKPVYNHSTGELKGRVTRSTTDLDTEEMTDYLEKLLQFASDLGEEVPQPAPVEHRERIGVN